MLIEVAQNSLPVLIFVVKSQDGIQNAAFPGHINHRFSGGCLVKGCRTQIWESLLKSLCFHFCFSFSPYSSSPEFFSISYFLIQKPFWENQQTIHLDKYQSLLILKLYICVIYVQDFSFLVSRLWGISLLISITIRCSKEGEAARLSQLWKWMEFNYIFEIKSNVQISLIQTNISYALLKMDVRFYM